MRVPRAIGLQPLLLALVTTPAIAQNVTISGRVYDAASGAPVVGAGVSIGGPLQLLTDESGEFRFTNARPGAHNLTIEALGYSRYTQLLQIRADTTLDIRLAVNPILLDSLRISARNIAVEGFITERETGKAVMDADVYATRGRSSRTKVAGRFEFGRVPAGVPFELLIYAFALEPVRLTILPERDTTLRIQMAPDTMVLRLVAQQNVRLESRLKDVVGKAISINRAELLRAPEGNLHEVLAWIKETARYSFRNGTMCTYVDEQLIGAQAIEMLYPEQIHRVEFYFDGAMIRVYTKRWIARLLGEEKKLARPTMLRSPAGFMGPGSSRVTCPIN